MTTEREQDEGGPDRLYLGIDGTMGDAQDVKHPFIESVHGSYCRVCGLGSPARCHGSQQQVPGA